MSNRIKSIFVLGIFATAVWFVVPTFQAYLPGGDPTSIRNKVNLGLDLQGGMYLDVEVDTEAAVDRMLDNLALEIEDALLDALVDYLRVEREGREVVVEIADGERIEWNEDPFDRLMTSFDRKNVSPTEFRVSLLPEEAERIGTGSVVIEQIFGIPGLGRFFVQGALNRDYTLVMGVVIFYGVLIILANLAVDLIYGWLDPKVRY